MEEEARLRSGSVDDATGSPGTNLSHAMGLDSDDGRKVVESVRFEMEEDDGSDISG